jgi:hypothetical protein
LRLKITVDDVPYEGHEMSEPRYKHRYWPL